jgi:hypothetical protein
MNIQNLRFFDSNSDDLNLLFNQDTNIWEGVCYLPEVSTGLYETLTIHILEKAVGSLGDELYVTPISNLTGNSYFKATFLNDYEFSDDIFLYGISPQDGELFIQKNKEQKIKILDSSYIVSTGNATGVNSVSYTTPSNTVAYNITLNSEVEGYHTRILEITMVNDTNSTVTPIANIRIYGEVEGEDERLRVLLSNMGMLLEESDYFIFKKSDIKELSTDWKILNEKRKELLLQASKIKPFIGTYKALLNAINFFGYDKITLKEYWLNINEQSENFGKLKAVAVPGQDTVGFLANKNNDTRLPNSNLKKTSRFSLVYRLNEADGGVDEWDIPTVKESTDFSPDEVLIKLYGLKRKLQKQYLPLQAKIVDITGEGDYFSQFNLNVWNNQHMIKNQTAGVEVDFKKYPENRQLFIEDLRKVDYRLTGINQTFPLSNQTDNEEVIDAITSFYETYYDNDLDTFNTLNGIPIGAPVILNVESYKDKWNDAEFSWMDAEDTGDSFLQWNNWWHRNVYEVEWVISGPRGYLKTFRGSIENYSKFPIILPYVGDYNVELALYDLFNFRSVYRKSNYINVKSKNVQIYGITQKLLPKLNWNQYRYSWNVAGSDWDNSAENTEEVQDIIATYYLTLDRSNYVHDANDVGGFAFSTVRRFMDENSETGFSETTGPYRWNELKPHVWNDGPEINWDMTRIGGDINASFKINLAEKQNGHLFIMTRVNPITNVVESDQYVIQSTYPTSNVDVTAYFNVTNELNSLDPHQHPIISKFNFNAIAVDSDGDSSTGSPPLGYEYVDYILAVGKEPSKSYDYEDVFFNNPLGGEIIDGSKQHHLSYNPNFFNLAVINSQEELKILNHLTLSYDITNMPGVVSQRWVLKNNTINVDDIYYNNKVLTYLFKHKGDYSVELELTDVNGNKNTTNKNIIKII